MIFVGKARLSLYTACMAKNSIFLFAGKNRYALETERKRWEKEFAERHGTENLLQRSGIGLALRELLDDVSVAPFLAEKRLVVVDGLPKFDKQEVEVLLQSIHPAVILLFLERPTKGRSPGKELSEVCSVKQFPELRTPALIAWAVTRATEEGFTLSKEAADRLVMMLEGDQQFIDSEVRKLALLFEGKTVVADDLESVVLPLEGVPWSMTDAILARTPGKAVLSAKRLLETGADAFSLWNAALAFLRNLVAVTAATEAGMTGTDAIGAKTGVHPFVLRNMLPLARSLRTADIAPLVDRAVAFDIKLKTGRLRATDDALDELIAALDSVLMGFPQ